MRTTFNPIGTPRPGLYRSVAFRLAAIGLGISSLIFFDRILGLWLPPRAVNVPDAFVEFHAIRPLFVRNESSGQYETAKDRQAYFRSDAFKIEKPANAYRVFCLGGSTVQGRPFSIETSFTTWLELALAAADPSREFEIVNCGGISYASYRLVPILEEVLGYDPNLIVLYTGHNEFLEDRTYREIKEASEAEILAHRVASRFNFYHLIRDWRIDALAADDRGQPARPGVGEPLQTEVTTRLDHPGGLKAYHRDPTWQADIVRHYRLSLTRMIVAANAAGVPVLLINPTENLRDCPPFKSEHREGLSEDQLQQWQRHRTNATSLMASNPRGALDELLAAIAIDDLYAGTYYQLGRCYDALLMPRKAEKAYRQAMELDVCPLRMTEVLHTTLLDVAQETETPLLDARELFRQLSADEIPGDDVLVDHVHPSVTGHQRLADAIAERLVAWDVVNPDSSWGKRRQHSYDQHLASLDSLYFFKGLQNRENLRAWAAGRVKKPGY